MGHQTQRCNRKEALVKYALLFFTSGGLSNHLYYCGLPEQVKPRGREPSEVLLRLFGKHLQKNSDSESSEYFIAAMVLENVIFTLLSERNLGPKLMGVFAGGRLEEFIQVCRLYIFCNINRLN